MSEITEKSQDCAPEDVKNNDVKTVGEYFKSEREKRNFELYKMSQETRISMTMLEFFESDDIDRLPNKAYIAGYVRSYSKALGLDQEKCLELFERTYGISRNKRNQNDKSSMTHIYSKMEKKGFRGWAFLAFVATLVLVGFLVFKERKGQGDEESKGKLIRAQVLSSQTPLMNKVVSPQVLVPGKPDDQMESANKTPEGKVSAGAATEKPEEKKVLEKTEKEEQETTKEAFKKINFRPLPVNMYKLSTGREEVLKHLPQRVLKASKRGMQNLYIKAVDGETWLTYKKDDAPIRKVFLKKDGNLFLQGKEIRIFFGNVNVSRLFLNGKLLEVNSSRGVKSLVFPQENSSKYNLPLFVYMDSGKVYTSDEYKAMEAAQSL